MSSKTRAEHDVLGARAHRASAFIKPYEFRGLKGRYLHYPSQSDSGRRTFVLLYGHHATIERIFPIVQALSEYGDVYMADNPGFGGMEAGYKIKQKPSLDFYADNLKNFIDDYIPADRHLTIVGISYGFEMIVEFAQRYPEYHKRIEEVVSFAGFASPQSFNMNLLMTIVFKYLGGGVGGTWFGSKIFGLMVNPRCLHFMYRISWRQNVKFHTIKREDVHDYIEEQVVLWNASDHRTHGRTGWEFLTGNDLSGYRLPNVKLIHLGIPKDHFLDNKVVSRELGIMFPQSQLLVLNLPNHAPLDMEDPDKIRSTIPKAVTETLRTSANKTAVVK